jgi:hypothetical protein
MYIWVIDVAVTELRAHLGRWIEPAREGTDAVIIGRPTRPTRPVAGDRHRPTPKRPVAEIIGEQRR